MKYRPKVVFFYRKRRKGHNFSIENIFKDVQSRLPGTYSSEIKISKYFSKGFLPRILSIFDARRFQGDINHITGDVNFLNYFFNKDKTILTIHDVGYIDGAKGLKKLIFKIFWLKIPIFKSRYVTVVSKATKKEVLKYVKNAEKKIKVIPSSVSDKFKFKTKSKRSSIPRILQIGTAPNKNLPRLVAAIKDIDCHIDIVGKLSEDQIELLKENNIQYSNFYELTDEEMVQRYERCDLLTFVSTYEGFGMPIIEANLVGRPVITSNLYSMPDVAGNAACIVDPYSVTEINKGIKKILSDQTYYDMLVENGKLNACRYSAQSIAEMYFKLYDSIILNENLQWSEKYISTKQ